MEKQEDECKDNSENVKDTNYQVNDGNNKKMNKTETG